MSNQTSTSENIIRKLINNDCNLTEDDKEIIRNEVWVLATADFTSNGCDCGQVACGICGG